MELTLGTALALLGGAVLLALAVHGWWSTRQARPSGPRGADPVLPSKRVEPALDSAAPLVAEPGARRSGIGVKRGAPLDALIDAIVPLQLEAPIAAELALQHLPPTRRVGSKTFCVEGLDAQTGAWEPIEAAQPGQRFTELQAGVQMASRSGPLNEIEYSEFVQKIEAFSEAIGATVKWAEAPDMLEAVARARELDSLAGPLDAQLSVTLRANGAAWSVAYLQQVAARHGFVPGAVPGRLVLPSAGEGEPPMLVLAVDSQAALAEADQGPQHGAVRECVLTLDVPQTPAAAEPFPAWHRAATQLAEDLDATATDDNGEPITLHAYATIGNDLQTLYQRLEQLELAAGSAAARRLFS